jgi:hypothetical protein
MAITDAILAELIHLRLEVKNGCIKPPLFGPGTPAGSAALWSC